jgi:hypothetical protein
MVVMNQMESPSQDYEHKIEILEVGPMAKITKVDDKDLPTIRRQCRIAKSSPKVATFPTDSNIHSEDNREDRNSQSRG